MPVYNEVLKRHILVYIQFTNTMTQMTNVDLHLVLSYSLPHYIKCGVLLYYLAVEVNSKVEKYRINHKYIGYRACGESFVNVTTELEWSNIKESL